jgi:hypothetical protein
MGYKIIMSPLSAAQSTYRVAIADFWHTVLHSAMMEKLARAGAPGGGGGCTPTPFQPIITITYKVAVYAPAEGADTIPLFHLYPICTLWSADTVNIVNFPSLWYNSVLYIQRLKKSRFRVFDAKGVYTILRPNQKKKHGVWDPIPELTITTPYVDSKTFTLGSEQPYARVDLNP